MIDGIHFLVVSVQAGSFAAAARKLGVTPSAVSRRVAQLEQELGVALLARTTRSLRLTHDGQAFFDRCVHALSELEEAQASLARVRDNPSGVLRVETSTNLGRFIIGPSLSDFLDHYPDVSVHMTLRDQLVDPVVEGADVLVRIGPLSDSNLIARKLAESRLVRCASPSYLSKHGAPESPAALARHRCIGYLADGRPRPFSFLGDQGEYHQAVDGPCHVNDGEVIRQLALAGRGIVAMFDFMVREALEAGTLIGVLTDYPSPSWPIHALYPTNRHLLPKVRVFIDHLVKVFGNWGGVGLSARASSAALRAPSSELPDSAFSRGPAPRGPRDAR